MASSVLSGSATDTRRKQSRKDEAIRKKIENELARKRTISTAQPLSKKKSSKNAAPKGTVAALRPSPALTVPESITVSDASQLCAAKRTDCVLVVDDEEGLCGIFTAKDLAYRVTAEGLDPRVTPVSAIMTRNPMVTRDTTSATEALQLMVQRHFRHLPVCNEDGNVVGLLDITKVFHEALEKVERGSTASQKLYSALEGVQSELGPGMAANPAAAAMLAYVESLREKTALPDLTTVMDSRTNPAVVGPRNTVKEATKLMQEHRTTAVCVMESQGGGPPRIAGIFTSKDVVLRVIAAGLDPGRCSVVRVMTPHPDCAPPTLSVQDALKKMYNGRYLNLPVVEADGRLVAIVDVLKLTYATLEQMNAIAGGEGATPNEEGGPLWGRFFDSIGQDDNESVISSHLPADFPPLPATGSSTSFEVHPNDSASVVDDEPAQSVTMAGAASAVSTKAVEVDDGTYVFKFSTPGGRTHRFQARHDSVENLRDIVAGKVATDPFITNWKGEQQPDPNDFHLAYVDSDGDTVFITSDGDVMDAVKVARRAKLDRVVLYLHGGKTWEPEKPKEVPPVIELPPPPPLPVKEDIQTPAIVTAPPAHVHVIPEEEKIFGVLPKDMLLPASIGLLAVVMIGVFTIQRFAD